MQFNVLSPGGLTVRLKKQDLVLNLANALNSIGSYQFLNMAKTTHTQSANGASGVKSGQDAIDAGYLDSNQQPTSACTSYTIYAAQSSIFSEVDTFIDGEDITIRWDGGGSLGTPVLGVKPGTTPSVNNTTRVATLTMGNPGTTGPLGLVWTISGTPPTNIRVYQTRYENDITIRGITYPGVLNGGIFNPHWVDWIRDAGVLRFMDWMVTNSSAVVNYSDIPTEAHAMWTQRKEPTLGSVKEGVPISLIWKLAILADCDVWLCFPHQATNACVDAIMTELWSNLSSTTKKIWVEYSNEPWNFGFGQLSYFNAQSIIKYGVQQGMNWHGFRAAEVMGRCINVVGSGNRSRLYTVLNCQTTWVDLAINIMMGVDDWLADGTRNTLGYTQRSQIINARGLTLYFNNYLSQEQVVSITKGTTTTVIVSGSSTCQVGDEIIFGMIHGGGGRDTGMPEIDGQYGTTLTRSYSSGTDQTTLTFNINSSSYTNFQFGDGGAWLSDSKYWRLMQKSIDLFNVPGQTAYRDQYHYACSSLANLARTGTFTFTDSAGSHTLTDTSNTIAAHNDPSPSPSKGWWTGHKAAADPDGISIVQYEAGPTWGSGVLVAGRGTQNTYGTRFENFSRAYADSPECAAVYQEGIMAFRAVGGSHPARYHDMGYHGANNGWGALRNLPLAGDPASAGMDTYPARAVKAAMKLKLAP
jgi:hypothetical protein